MAKSILLAITNYFMNIAIIPGTMCNDIERIARKFIWGSNGLERKNTLVNWKEVCLPIEKGGLGIRKLQD